jgi:hypothetical protein
LSRGARWTLGVFCLLFAAIFVLTTANAPNATAVIVLWLCAGFCMLISLACFSKVASGPAVRIIGTLVFLAYVAYLVGEIRKGLWRPYYGTASEHWVNAILGLIVFGLPGIYVALHGVYPRWGKGAKAFLGEEQQNAKDENEDDSGG